ncbi:hypothetical protein [Paenibacillus terrae]
MPELMHRIKELDDQIHKLMELQNEQAQLKQQLVCYWTIRKKSRFFTPSLVRHDLSLKGEKRPLQ